MAQHQGDFPVLMAFDVVEDEDHAITRRQSGDGPFKRNAIQDADGLLMMLAIAGRWQRNLNVVRRFLNISPAFIEVHQDMVARDAQQPCLKRRLTAKAADVAQNFDENFLR